MLKSAAIPRRSRCRRINKVAPPVAYVPGSPRLRTCKVKRCKSWILTDVADDIWLDTFAMGSDAAADWRRARTGRSASVLCTAACATASI